MKVGDLIKQLQQLDPDLVVTVTDPDCHNCRQVAVSEVFHWKHDPDRKIEAGVQLG